MLSRVARIFEQLNSAWDVLRTMTPSEYTEFRDSLGQSSGFQSWQYRAIEFLAGNRNLGQRVLGITLAGRIVDFDDAVAALQRQLPHLVRFESAQP